ncbi:LysR family transcriptional regulator [Lactobacillus xylocopicola]|uniref:LysR family transcriptional regulator n=1 Tax=Lactobacillus xylocopicola TaxID=2976676 RepID=A0ABM8BIL1_9LACO|nr:LysR family transcriptional regulator [Lactobacillus xylocopicola]BDR61154.1 LysR family transcriptional regulator [Lactobacillus xylocopicola]
MNFNDLSIYQTIYETQSLNKAAKELGYSQSNLTARLQALEKELNAPLFIRSNSGIRPTTNGEQVYKFTVSALHNLDALKDKLADRQPQMLSSELLFDYLLNQKDIFLLEHYDVTIKKTDQFQDILARKEFDVVLSFTPTTLPNYSLVKEDQLTATFLQGKPSTNSKLPIAINSDYSCPFRQLTCKLFPNQNDLIEIDSLEMILQLVKQQRAIALLPCHLINDQLVQASPKRWSIPYYHYRNQL